MRLRLGTSFPSRIADFSLRIGIRSKAADTVETLRPRVSSQANSNPIVRTVLALLSLPDGAQHMIAPFVRAATEVLEEGADVLYTTSPPYSLALAGLLLRQRFNIPWVAELRDPWVHPWTDRQAASHPLTRTVDALLESQVLQRAELLVAVTEAMRNHLASAPNPNVRGKVILARNGIPNLGGSAGQSGSSGGTGPFRIVHAGSLYMGRNPTAFLTGLARFVARTPLSPGQLQVDFIGKCRKYGGRSVQSLIQDLGLSEIVHIEDWMPHGEVIALLRGGRPVRALCSRTTPSSTEQALRIPRTDRTCARLCGPGGESDLILQQIGHGESVFTGDPEQVASALGRLYSGSRRRNASAATTIALEALSTRQQMKRLVLEVEARFAKQPGCDPKT